MAGDLMPNVSLTNFDAAGGTIRPSGQIILSVSGNLVAVIGDPVDSHGKDEHRSPVMAQGSTKFTVSNIPICLMGHVATCGHGATGGNPKFFVSS